MGTTVDAALQGGRHATRASTEEQGIYRFIYNDLAENDSIVWKGYWSRRLLQRGLDPALVEAAVRSIPRQTPQTDRWNLLKMQLSAIPTAGWLQLFRTCGK